MSWAPHVPWKDVRSYTYEEENSRDTYIYVIDEGLDPTHSVRYSEIKVDDFTANHSAKRISPSCETHRSAGYLRQEPVEP